MPNPVVPSGILAPAVPLARSASSQYVGIKTYSKLALQNLKMLILTIPGERMMDVDFGVGLVTYLFEMNEPSVRAEISSKIYEQVSIYLPYIEILDISYNSVAEDKYISDEYLGIKITFNIKPIGSVVSLSLSLNGSDVLASEEFVTYSD